MAVVSLSQLSQMNEATVDIRIQVETILSVRNCFKGKKFVYLCPRSQGFCGDLETMFVWVLGFQEKPVLPSRVGGASALAARLPCVYLVPR